MRKKGRDGKPTTSPRCKSVYHFMSRCDKEDGIVLQVGVIYTKHEGETKEESKQWEDQAILHLSCNANIAGTQWIENYTRDKRTEEE